MAVILEKPYKLGLALSGGGAKGFAHLGVFRLFEECNLRPDIISGTSAGALAGALYADGYSSEEIIHMFSGKEFSEFARIQIPNAGLFEMKRMNNFLKKYLRARRIEDLSIPMVIMATDLDRGISHEFRGGPLIEALVASSSVPIIFSPVEIDGTHYVDGGVFRNFPVTPIREECDKIVGVNVSPMVPVKYKQTIYHIAERSYHYMFRANTTEDRLLCDVLIEAEEFGAYKMFDLENVDKLADVGYEAAIKAFDDISHDSKFDLLVREAKKKRNMLES